MTRQRAGAVIVLDGAVALIERRRAGRVYYVFPGGGVEPGETVLAAVGREVHEELGVTVAVGALVAQVWFADSEQHYFQATIIGGDFGSGAGPEFSADAPAERGSYRPVWLALDELSQHEVVPAALARCVARVPAQGWPAAPLVIRE